MIKYVFFDIYQTLLDVDIEQKNIDKAWKVFEDYLVKQKIDMVAAAKFKNYFDETESEFYRERDKKLYHHDWIENIYSVMNNHYHFKISRSEAESLLWSFRQKSCEFCRVYPGVKETLERLSQRFILSTVSLAHGSITERELEQTGIKKYFTHLIFTSQVGFRKPSKELYERALQIVGANKDNSIMVGDNLNDDIYGANRVGMWTLWIKNPLTLNIVADVIPDCTVCIKDFSGIEKKIDILNSTLSD